VSCFGCICETASGELYTNCLAGEDSSWTGQGGDKERWEDMKDGGGGFRVSLVDSAKERSGMNFGSGCPTSPVYIFNEISLVMLMTSDLRTIKLQNYNTRNFFAVVRR
jgi:hypothetical protein